eukprot:m.236870 g.236870  ORF g.236870 m.236870 type:complete len:824 (+) comp16054_c0_seq12:317-2788(+)
MEDVVTDNARENGQEEIVDENVEGAPDEKRDEDCMREMLREADRVVVESGGDDQEHAEIQPTQLEVPTEVPSDVSSHNHQETTEVPSDVSSNETGSKPVDDEQNCAVETETTDVKEVQSTEDKSQETIDKKLTITISSIPSESSENEENDNNIENSDFAVERNLDQDAKTTSPSLSDHQQNSEPGDDKDDEDDSVRKVKFIKVNSSIGLKVSSARGANRGVLVTSVGTQSPAHTIICPGDEVLEVNGVNMVGATASAISSAVRMCEKGAEVTFGIRKPMIARTSVLLDGRLLLAKNLRESEEESPIELNDITVVSFEASQKRTFRRPRIAKKIAFIPEATEDTVLTAQRDGAVAVLTYRSREQRYTGKIPVVLLNKLDGTLIEGRLQSGVAVKISGSIACDFMFEPDRIQPRPPPVAPQRAATTTPTSSDREEVFTRSISVLPKSSSADSPQTEPLQERVETPVEQKVPEDVVSVTDTGTPASQLRRRRPHQSPMKQFHEEQLPSTPGEEYFCAIIPMPLDDLHDFLFGDSAKFFHAMCKRREFSCVEVGEWKVEQNGQDARKQRILQYKVPLNVRLGPKSTKATETQFQSEGRPGRLYVVESSVQTPTLPYGTSFSVKMYWSMTCHSSTESKLRVTCRVEFIKKVWNITSNFITKATADGMKQFWHEARNVLDDFASQTSSAKIEHAPAMSPSPSEPGSRFGTPMTSFDLQMRRRSQLSITRSLSRYGFPFAPLTPPPKMALGEEDVEVETTLSVADEIVNSMLRTKKNAFTFVSENWLLLLLIAILYFVLQWHFVINVIFLFIIKQRNFQIEHHSHDGLGG